MTISKLPGHLQESYKQHHYIGTLQVMGYPIHVIAADLAERGNAGESSFVEKIIAIGYTQNASDVVSTLLHEVFHVVLAASGMSALLGDDKIEESLVISLETGVTPLVQGLLSSSIEGGMVPLTEEGDLEISMNKKSARKKTTHSLQEEITIRAITHFLTLVNGKKNGRR